MYLKLIRRPADGLAVRGTLYIVGHDSSDRETLTELCSTMENLRYQVLPLIYRVEVTYSPKFKRLLPVLCSVPGRSGIRFHCGTRPEHSKGCILVEDQTTLRALLTIFQNAQQRHEEVYLEYMAPAPGALPRGMGSGERGTVNGER